MDLSSMLDPTYLLTFLGGTAVGAAGTYYADLFTDQRKQQERKKEEQAQFDRLKSKMPKLLHEMKQDLIEKKDHHMREFVILASEVTCFQSEIPRFSYFETVHPAARNQADILLNEGYVDVVQVSNPRIYRFKETFVERLINDA